MAHKKRDIVFEKTNGKCFYCGCKLSKEYFHMDHFLAKSKHGKGGDNLVPCCPDCNLAKANKSIGEFRRYIENLPASTNRCRLLSRYYKIKSKPIRFWFEEQ